MTTPATSAHANKTGNRFDGSERFRKNKKPLRASVLDFWQWGYSGLRELDVFQRLGMYVTAMALSVDTANTVYNAELKNDLAVPGGIRVSVRTKADVAPRAYGPGVVGHFYLNLEYGPRAEGFPKARAIRNLPDCYVFARPALFMPSLQDLLDLDVWEFYLLSGAMMNEIGWGRKILRVSQIASEGAGPVSAAELPSALRAYLARVQTPETPPKK